MADAHRDPDVVGYEWAAWWALQGDEPLDRVRECAVHLQQALGTLGCRLAEAGDSDGNKVVGSANLFMVAIAELLDENGRSEFKAKIERRKRGKPIDKHARALRGHEAASIVIQLVAEGWKQEAALEQATIDVGLSRAEIMTWLQHDRAALAGG